MSAASIPYEKQSDAQSNRTCGAACLSMVYRSLGKEVPQSEIWPAISRQNRFGNLASTTHLMAQDALTRGFSAVAIQARHPLQVLRLCHESGIRGILNHRLQPDASAGHYSVLVDIDDKNLVLHDPFFGPSRHLSYAELLELWQPRFPNSEIVGHVLIGIAAQLPALPACQFCHTPRPIAVECPRCKKPVQLQPCTLLGCMNDSCIARMWNYLCCPSCDYTWNFSIEPPEGGKTAVDVLRGKGHAGASSALSAVAAGGAPSAADPMILERLFGELDKFCNFILASPAGAKDPAIRQQLDFIAASKEKMRLARIETLAHRQMVRDQLMKLQEEAKKKEEVHRQRMEKLNTPAPPLDGDALGRALLKNLGLTS
ncbi:MAG TPA: cysteine peptidase family C39 domain-containing protein [Bryobacteraceae bacterium]|nr:cysteine peptidase family C39 domain-containing protein [Bryobacteraceae bacterium]